MIAHPKFNEGWTFIILVDLHHRFLIICIQDFLIQFSVILGALHIKNKVFSIQHLRWKGINNCMSPYQGNCWLSIRSLKISVGNIITAKSLQKSRKQFASRRKRSPPLEPGSCLGYISILIHLFLKLYRGEASYLIIIKDEI